MPIRTKGVKLGSKKDVFVKGMAELCGRVFTIVDVIPFNRFMLKGVSWNFTEEMVEKVITNKDMKTKEFKVSVPKGYEIDKENSTFECIKFKPKSITYDDVIHSLSRKYKYQYYISNIGCIDKSIESFTDCTDANNAYSEKQLQKLLAINKLMTVAKYLNDGWKPNWEDGGECKYCIEINSKSESKIVITYYNHVNVSLVFFKTEELAQKAIKILGEDTIRLALTTDY